KKNAFTNAMYLELAEWLERADQDAAIRVVLFTAHGEMFSAGNDMTEFLDIAEGRFTESWHVFRYMRSLASLSKPLVAAAQGKAVGIGATMLLHCDVVILAEDARLSTPFVNLALSPEAGSSALLTALVGHQLAFAMFALGRVLDATEAARVGLATEVVPLAGLHDRAKEVADKLATLPLGSLMTSKGLIRDKEATVARIEHEERLFMDRLKSAEALEAFRAFQEKRPPKF
ncbi:MAG: enoyl-CoA hydratase/isomerase family protein, partial [Burkholderiales bacterium]|nr:enoyl-CoA hydratase/isomerase family protein [Burkholderiales bacterium]